MLQDIDTLRGLGTSLYPFHTQVRILKIYSLCGSSTERLLQ